MKHDPLDNISLGDLRAMVTEGRLTDTERRHILTAIGEIQAAEGISNSDLAGMLGGASISASVISQVKSGKYKGSTDRVIRAFRQWIEDRATRIDVPDADFANTTDGRRIMTVCDHALAVPCMAQVITPAGCGKTAALREYHRRQGGAKNPRCIYMEIGEGCRTKRAFSRAFAKALNIPVGKSGPTDIVLEAIHERLAGFYLTGKGTPGLLLLDEATSLAPATLTLIRNFHDNRASRLAVVFADTWTFDRKLHNRGREEMDGGYEQLRSRMGAVHKRGHNDDVALADVKVVADSVLRSLGCRTKLAAHAYKYLHGIAQAEGKLRNVQYRLHAVYQIAARCNVTPEYSVAQLDFAAQLVGMQCEIVHDQPPFGNPKPEPAPAKRAARRTA